MTLIEITAPLFPEHLAALQANCTHVTGRYWIMEGDTDYLRDEGVQFTELADGAVGPLGDLTEPELVTVCHSRFGIRIGECNWCRTVAVCESARAGAGSLNICSACVARLTKPGMIDSPVAPPKPELTVAQHRDHYRGQLALALDDTAQITRNLANAIRPSPMRGCVGLGVGDTIRSHIRKLEERLTAAEESARAIHASEQPQTAASGSDSPAL